MNATATASARHELYTVLHCADLGALRLFTSNLQHMLLGRCHLNCERQSGRLCILWFCPIEECCAAG